MYSTDNKEKSAFKRGFTLDGAGRATGLFPSGSRAGSQDPDAALKSMLTDSDAARLSEFCAVAPVPSGVREAAAANSAVFSLVSDRFSYGVAVKERIFGGTAAVFYLMEKGECPAGAPPLLPWRLPDDVAAFADVAVAGGGTGGVLRALSQNLRRRVGIDDPAALDSLVRSVVRRLSGRPELCCGKLLMGSGPSKTAEAGVCVSLCAGAFADLTALLVSSLNSVCAAHVTTAYTEPRGGSVTVFFRSSGAGRDVFDLFGSPTDLLSLAARLPACFDRLALAYCVSCASGIPVGTFSDKGSGECGFTLTLAPEAEPAEFKGDFAPFDADPLFDELDRLFKAGGAVPDALCPSGEEAQAVK